MRNISLLALILLLGLLAFKTIAAGEIAYELAGKIAKSGPSDKIAVVITLKNSVSPSSLKSDLETGYKTMAERRRAGIARLKDKAEISQAALLSSLEKMRTSGLAANIKSHWIANVITTELAASEIKNIAFRSDVAAVMQQPGIGLIEPIDDASQRIFETPMNSADIFVVPNLMAVGADSAWNLGLHGEGRIICSFDTGVEGLHPALFKSWKGHDGDSAAAWFDPIDRVSFPHVFSELGDTKYHGSHTMGIMVGLDSTYSGIGIATGVAPGARWISAAVVNIMGASYIDAFEWAADPDGDPNTIDDVPDVINHSWGYKNSQLDCSDYFWEMIDNTEALGTVNVFSAGNEGTRTSTISNPANRAANWLNSFAVGALDNTFQEITTFSSRGPSDCDDISIKPNIVAPGDDIVSVNSSAGYGPKDGTSMAAPHVSAAVAILRQHAPDATVDQIKTALLIGCRQPLSSDTLPNNIYGWGSLYIPAALTVLDSLMAQPQPDLRVYSFDYSPVDPGGTVNGYVEIKNFGDPINTVFAVVAGSDGDLNIFTDTLDFGTIESGAVAQSDIPFVAVVSDTITPGQMFTVYLDLYGSGGYHRLCKIYIQVGTAPMPGFYTHRNDLISFTVSNFGEYGFASGSFYPLGYAGFRYADSLRNDLFEGALIIGTDSMHVSDGARNLAEEPDNDYAVAPEGDIIINVPGSKADQMTASVFDDRRAEHPLGLEVRQKTYSWNDLPDNNFVILEYEIKNISDSSIPGICIGLILDWDLNNTPLDAGGFVEAANLGYMYHEAIPNPHVPPQYRGVSVLNPEGLLTHTLRINPLTGLLFAMSENEKYLSLSGGNLDSTSLQWYNRSQIISTGPMTLFPGQLDTAVFAIIADTLLEDLTLSASQAGGKYDIVTDVEAADDRILPDRLSLGQNYPNPFNPATTIFFTLARRSDVTLTIYNLIGEKITELLDGNLAAGNYEIIWEGKDKRGKELASGVYFYRLKTDQSSITRKMVFLK